MVRRLTFAVLAVFACLSASGQTFTFVPTTAPRGARVLFAGEGVASAGVTVKFASATGRSAAAIVSVGPSELEALVPSDAVSGTVTLERQSSVLASFDFTLAEDPRFVGVRTLVSAKDLLQRPSGLALAADGTVYVADTLHDQIRVFSPQGVLLATIGTGKPGLADGPAAQAKFAHPAGVAFDPNTSVLYVADTGNHAIRTVVAGVVSTIAGDGKPGDADGTSAHFKSPQAVAISRSGVIYVADTGNHKIRSITAGNVTTVAGTGNPGWTDGPPAKAQFHEPSSITVGRDGALYVADANNHALRRIDAAGVSTLAGGGGPGLADGNTAFAAFQKPQGAAVDEGLDVYVADTLNHSIRRISANVVTTIAGTGKPGFVDGLPLTAQFSAPAAVDALGAIFVADANNNAIRVIDRELALRDVYPRRGDPAGGTVVRLFGTGFVPGATAVRFGATAATSVTFISGTELLVTVPPGNVGTADVIVSTPAGTSVLANGWQYAAPFVSIAVVPSSATVEIGANRQFTATGTRADGTTVDISSLVTWSSTAPAFFSVSPTGLVHGLSAGSGFVRASYGGLLAEAAVQVIEPFVSLSVTPSTARLEIGQSAQFTALALRQGGGTVDVTSQVSWTSSDISLLTIDSSGLAQAVAAGPVTVRATLRSLTGQASVTVVAPVPVPVVSAITVVSPSARVDVGQTRQFRAMGIRTDGTAVEMPGGVTWTSSAPSFVTVDGTGLARGVGAGTATITAKSGTMTATASVTVVTPPVVPPDPATIAPPIAAGVVTSFSDSNRFIYSGPNAIQTNVMPGAIDEARVAIVRGRVLARDGQPLRGVAVSVLNHPEIGRTLSRADGEFDLAVNGGGALTIVYERSGFLPAQRPVTAEWQGFTFAPDVQLAELDRVATPVDLTSPAVQVARGSLTADEDGARRATVLFNPGTQASIVLPGGTRQAATHLTVRATEYTVGRDSADMPAPLPPNTAYTYAVELSADEAMAVNATTIEFTKPVVFYVDNFLSFPAGTAVPVGYYDRARASWIAMKNGRVIAIIGVIGGLASIDITGDGIADDVAALTAIGITDGERQALAATYAAGKSLWRAQLDHFTPCDLNWAYASMPGVKPPTKVKMKSGSKGVESPACSYGSIIECQNQTLGESVPLVGAPYSLAYRSDRVPGRASNRTITADFSEETLPPGVNEITVEFTVAGKRYSQTFPPNGNHNLEVIWDGTDAYGRYLEGQQEVTGRVGYVVDGAFGAPPSGDSSFGGYGGRVLMTSGRVQVTLWQEQRLTVERLDLARNGLGAWSLSPHHAYDPFRKVLYLGTGERRSAETIGQIITHVAGTGVSGDPSSGDGGPAASANFDYVTRIAFASDGTAYVTDRHTVRRIRNGIITAFAGTGTSGHSGDGGPATSAQLSYANGLLALPDGSVLIGEQYYIRRVTPDGIITTIAGNGSPSGPLGDGGPAAASPMGYVTGLALGPNGDVYLADGDRVRRIDPAGIITTVLTASNSLTWNPTAVAVGPDGAVYVGTQSGIVRRGNDGSLTRFAGGGSSPDDGIPATEADLWGISALAFGADGALYAAAPSQGQVVAIRTDGTLLKVAGRWENSTGDGGLAVAALLNYPEGLAWAPDGSIYVCDSYDGDVRRISAAGAIAGSGELAVASADGSEIYVFETSGRHLRTVDSRRGSVLRTFHYSGAWLSSVVDADGNTVTIERDAAGTPTAIVAAGQRTTLGIDSNGYLTSVTNPAGESYDMTYLDGGLLATFKTPRRHIYEFHYDDKGKLQLDADPAGGFQNVARTGNADHYTVTLTTKLGRVRSHQVDLQTDGSEHRLDTVTDGFTTDTLTRRDGSSTITTSDGSVLDVTEGPDPRLGMLAPVMTAMKLKLASGLTMTATQTATAEMTDSSNPFTTTTETRTLTTNGRTSTVTWTAATSQVTYRTPLGRVITTTLDGRSRPQQIEVPGLAPAVLSYDSFGLSGISQGPRSLAIVRDTRGNVTSISDGTRTSTFTYDDAGRVKTQTLPGGEAVIGFGYDANGNVTSITPPGRPAHGFTYTPVDLEDSYTPPVVPGGGATLMQYNADRQLSLITRPDGSQLTPGYDGGGRLSALAVPGRSYGYTYAPTGQIASAILSDGVGVDYGWDGPLLTSMSWRGGPSSVSYSYDNDFRMTNETVHGAAAGYGYDADGLLTAAGALTLQRDPANGLLTGTTLGTVTDAWTYDTTGAPETYRASFGPAALYAESYVRDGSGRITQKSMTMGGTTVTTTYGYDGAGRLQTVTSGASTTSYAYDSNGNRLTRTVDGAVVESGVYDAQDRVTSYGGATYAYTANGELKSKTDATGTTTYEYDALGNLRHVGLPDGTAIDYVIDGQNRRVGKKVNGTLVRQWVYGDQLRIVAELDGAGAMISRFVYGSRANIPDTMVQGTTTYRILADHLGSPVMIVNAATGEIAETTGYDEWGNVLADSNPGLQPFGFAGGLYDRDTKLVRFGARDYDAKTGRWVTKDPVRLTGGTNLYRYSLNDPVGFRDSNGENPAMAGPAILGGILGGGTIFAYEALQGMSHGMTFKQAVSKCVKWQDVSIGAGVGILTGAAVPGLGLTWEGAAILGAVANTAQYAFTTLSHPGEKFDLQSASQAAEFGLLGGAIGGGSPGRTLIQQYRLGVGNFIRSLSAASLSNAPSGDTCGCQ